MKQIRINVTDSKSSKQEEIDVLNKLQESFDGTGSYLEGLFSRDFVAWCSQKITSDFIPDILGEMEAEQADGARRLHFKISEVTSLQNELQGMIEQKKELDYLFGKLEKETSEKAKMQAQRIENLLEQKRDITQRYVNNLDTLKDNEDKISQLEQKVLELKAKLYDKVAK